MISNILYLDRVGRNVAAGMTGGLAYILDEDDTLIPKVCTRICFTILSLCVMGACLSHMISLIHVADFT